MGGILAGRAGKLVYAENDNKAYEAPLGTNYARNYGARIVLAQRAKDGKAYFSVKTKSATKISTKTRTNMAILGSIAAIASAIQFGQTTAWANLHAIYEYRKEHGWDAAGTDISFNKWLDYWLRQMLQYKQESITITASGISVVVKSPYADYDSEATAIKQDVFAKFVPMLTTDENSIFFSVDGKQFVAKAMVWLSFNNDMNNVNYENMFTNFDFGQGEGYPVTYNGQPLYTAAGVAVTSLDTIISGEKYTTVAPQA